MSTICHLHFVQHSMILDDYYHSVVETLSGYEDMDETDMDETDVSGKFPPFFTSLSFRKSRESEFSYRFYPRFAQTGEFLAQAAAQFRGPPRFPTSTPLRPPPPPPPPPLALERTYRLHRGRSPQFPTVPRAQIPPRMTRMTPCGKCLRVIV